MLRRRGLSGLVVTLGVVAAAVATACGGDGDGGTANPPPGAAGDGGEEAVAGTGGSGGSSGSSTGEAGMGGVVEAGPFELLSRTPEPDEADVWFYEPIVLEFSNPLDEAATASAFTISIDGQDQAESLELSADGKRVTLKLSTPPIMAATATIEIADSLRDRFGNSFAAESWSYRLPLWQSPSEVGSAATDLPALVLDAGDRPIIAVVEAGEVLVRRFEGSAWVDLGGPLNPGGNVNSAPAIVFDGALGPVVAYRDATEIHVASFDGQAWTALGDALGTTDDGVALAQSAAGELLLALRVASGIEVRRWDGAAFAELATAAVTPGTLGGFALSLDAETPVLAYYDETPQLVLAARTGSDFTELASLPLAQTASGAPSLFVSEGNAYVAYVDHDDVSSNAFIRVLAKNESTLEPFGAALDLNLDADAAAPRIAAAADGSLAVSWTESQGGSTKLYAARSNAGRLQFLGPALTTRKGAIVGLRLAVDSHGNSNVAFSADGVFVERYNGSPETPTGLSARTSTKSCVIPATTSVDFPTTLTDTGCYADVAKHQVMAAALPYELNTALWSDAAVKHRFIVLPDGDTITATDTGAWKMPVGTIIIKEFWYEKVEGDPTSAFPMETRFLVKRCEDGGGCAAPIEGYSYRWNDAGTEATLLTDVEAPPGTGMVVKWPVTSGGDPDDAAVHSHTYPSRAQCVRCHNENIGRFLGLQTPQLNRPAAFAQAVDNQLRTFEAIGVFSKPLSAGGADAKGRLPSSNDPSFTLEERSLAYFHANCSHCHNPQGERPTIDFRYYGGAGLTADNICNKLLLGDSANSPIYLRDSSRPGGMPPIATLVKDDRELPVTKAWIDNLTSCP